MARFLLAPTSMPGHFCVVRLAAHVSNGLKSRIRPVVGRIKPKARVSIMRWNLKETGYWEHTNQWANFWSDEQKSYQAMHEGKTVLQVEAR